MVQIIGTLGAFCVACLVFLINRLAGGTWIPEDQFSTSNIVITTVIAWAVEAALIGYQIYKKNKASSGDTASHVKTADAHPEDDEYDFRPKKRNDDK